MRSRRADKQEVRQRMNLRWGVMPFRLDFEADPEKNIDRTFRCARPTCIPCRHGHH